MTKPLHVACAEADDRAATARTGLDLCTVAELYKRCGSPLARDFYEKAIAADPSEPVWELLFSTYFRVQRGAGPHPLLAEAERHLIAARRKLDRLKQLGRTSPLWDGETEDRIIRTGVALYERDGFQVLSRNPDDDKLLPAKVPLLFFGLGGRLARTTDDFEQMADVRARTSEAMLSSVRLHRNLTSDELRSIARLVPTGDTVGTVKIRYGSAPSVDVSFAGRKAESSQITKFAEPTVFNDVSLTGVRVGVEKAFQVHGNTDAFARFDVSQSDRTGVVEFRPLEKEAITSIVSTGALAQYAGPDRIEVSYVYVRQHIAPESVDLLARNRTIAAATAAYRIFRPLSLAGRSRDSELARRFETRGISLFAGTALDEEHFPDRSHDTIVSRRDYFLGVAAQGLGRFDVTLQPTWYTSRVSNDDAQSNGQLRMAGNVLFRILDEERTARIPKERLLGMPLAFTHVVVPFRWDITRNGIDAFQSRSIGVEVWTKSFAARPAGVTLLGNFGLSRVSYPVIAKQINAVRGSLSFGF